MKIKSGEEIPTLTKTASMPINPNSNNVIHTDDAKKFGMRGALVAGSILLSYILEMLYNYFGKNWLSYGKISVSFIGGGAINGDIVTAHGLVKSVEREGTDTRLYLDIWMENQMGVKIVTGNANCIQ